MRSNVVTSRVLIEAAGRMRTLGGAVAVTLPALATGVIATAMLHSPSANRQAESRAAVAEASTAERCTPPRDSLPPTRRSKPGAGMSSRRLPRAIAQTCIGGRCLRAALPRSERTMAIAPGACAEP